MRNSLGCLMSLHIVCLETTHYHLNWPKKKKKADKAQYPIVVFFGFMCRENTFFEIWKIFSNPEITFNKFSVGILSLKKRFYLNNFMRDVNILIFFRPDKLCFIQK